MKKSAQWRAQFLGTVVSLLITGGSLCYFWGWWVLQPLLLICFSIVGTQCGAEFGRRTLSNLTSKLNENSPSDEIHRTTSLQGTTNSRSSREEELIAVVTSRVQQAGTAAGSALNAYLSQLVGTFAMSVLVIGLCVIIWLQPQLGIIRPSWMATAVFIVPILMLVIFIWILLREPFYKSLSRFYDWHGFFPPPTALTIFRVAVLIIYCVLVFMLYYPNLTTSMSKP